MEWESRKNTKKILPLVQTWKWKIMISYISSTKNERKEKTTRFKKVRKNR